MPAAEVGALRITLGMDNAEFAEGAKETERLLDRFATRIGITAGIAAAAGTMVGNALTGMVNSIVDGVKDAISSAEEAADVAEKFGLSIETVSAFSKSGEVSVGALSGALEKLSQNLVTAASGDITSAAARALKALGISATDADGRLRTVADVLDDVADKFAKYRNGPEKAALSTALFGTANVALIAALNDGADGIEKMTDEAVELGLVLDLNTGIAARDLTDATTALAKAWDAFYSSIASRISPVLRDFASTLKSWADTAAQYAKPAAIAVADGINAIYISAIRAEAGIERFATKMGGFFRSALALFTSDEVKKIQDETEAAAREIDAKLAARLAKIDEMRQAAKPEEPDTKPAAPVAETTQKAGEAQRELNRLIQEGMNLAKASRDPYQVYIDSIKALDAALAAGKINAEQYGQAQQRAVLIASNAYAGAASSIAGSLTQVFNKSKGVAIAAAIINSFQAATNALAQVPYPLNFAAAAAALAAGFAQVANIRRTTESSGGGGGGGGGAASAPALTQAPQTLRIEGINPNQLYSGVAVRGIVDSVNDFVRNGGVLLSSAVVA